MVLARILHDLMSSVERTWVPASGQPPEHLVAAMQQSRRLLEQTGTMPPMGALRERMQSETT